MGQAWCKEKTSKAQDSKSPLDRVFVRCAHRIYPSLKEEGSVLGGATQRVTSSEIGYAGSPPREVLTRGRSIDSVDRPFHPSDWVDVNLEVPSTPRASSVLTNLTADTSLYPATTPTSSCSNLKDATPVPPPRRKKRNRGRPLPPKPDEIIENVSNGLKRIDSGDDPLYSSVKPPKSIGDRQDNIGEGTPRSTNKHYVNIDESRYEGKKAKEIYEHKVNGTGKIITSDIVSGKRSSSKTSSRVSEVQQQQQQQQHRLNQDDEEYERFVRNQSIKDSSTPRRSDGRKSGNFEKRMNDSVKKENVKTETNARPKNYSTVSLPNYDELDGARHLAIRTKDDERAESIKSRRPVRSSTGSLPAESFLSPFSQKTSTRLEDYVPRRGSSDNLLPYQVLGKLDCSENGVDDGGFVKYDPSKLEDWDLSDIGNCELNHQQRSFESSPIPDISENSTWKHSTTVGKDVVDLSTQNAKTSQDETSKKISILNDERQIPCDTTSIGKPEAFGKIPTADTEMDKDTRSKNLEDWIGQNRYFDPPTMEICKTSSMCEQTESSCREPFFLNEENHRLYLDTIAGSSRNGAIPESERSGQSKTILVRSLSNESEPYEDPYESKELRGNSAVTSKLIRTISEESLPREMLEEVDEVENALVQRDGDFFDEKVVKDVHNKLKKESIASKQILKTPPPSPEPKIKAEILDNDHSTLLKVLKEEAEESNPSSMTPSLTELEAALSDMLEKEEPQDVLGKTETEDDLVPKHSMSTKPTEKPIEPSIVPVPISKTSSFKDTGNFLEKDSDKILVDDSNEREDVLVSLGQIFEDGKVPVKNRKVSFCAWEEKLIDMNTEESQDQTDRSKERTTDSNLDKVGEESNENFTRVSKSLNDHQSVNDSKSNLDRFDETPEKPSRLCRSSIDEIKEDENVPTPPRRRNKSSSGTSRETQRISQSVDLDLLPNDRLI